MGQDIHHPLASLSASLPPEKSIEGSSKEGCDSPILGKNQVESTPLDALKVVLKRRKRWKIVHGLQQNFSVFQAILWKMGAEYKQLNLLEEHKRCLEAAKHSVRKCGCSVVPEKRRDKKTGAFVPTKAPGVARVQRMNDQGVMTWTWILQCASVWFCPKCAEKIMWRRREELTEGISALERQGFSFVFATFTIPHVVHVPLMEYMLRLQKVLKRFRSGKPWIKFREKYGMRYYIRGQEVTHGKKTGWHPHFHELLCFDRALTQQEKKEVGHFLRERWIRLCVEEGLTPENKISAARKHGVDIKCRTKNTNVQQEYFAKFAPWELSSVTTKAGRQEGNSHPFNLLMRLVDRNTSSEEFQALAHLWAEYMAAMRGRIAVFWSPGLKNFCGINDLTDEEICADGEVDLRVELEVEPKDFSIIGRAGKQTAILELLEKNKTDALWRLGQKLGAWMTIPDEDQEGEL